MPISNSSPLVPPGLPPAGISGLLSAFPPLAGRARFARAAAVSVGIGMLVFMLAQCWPGSARAASSTVSPYGEVSHFGGFGSGPAQFVVPVGFAVDDEEPKEGLTPDGDAIYVLDRLVAAPGELQYRLQKLSSAGTVLGSTILHADTYPASETESGANPLISLAVDHAAHRVYALVEGMVEARSEKFVPVAQRLVAWSTEPNQAKQLVAAEESPGHPYAKLDSPTGAALVAELEQSSSSEDLATPEGLAIDPASHDVIIEAQHGVVGARGGPTILQRVHTQGSESGHLGESWIADPPIVPSQEEVANGLFATEAGFGVDLYGTGGNVIPQLIEIKSEFQNPTPTLIAPDQSAGLDLDQAPSIEGPFTPANDRLVNSESLNVYLAGSPITQLSAGHLYAADFGYLQTNPNGSHTDYQSGGNPPFWVQDNPENGYIANMGVRVFEADGHIVTTIGGQPSGECSFDNGQMSIAAGAEGSLFVLTQPNQRAGNSGDEVIKFAPGKFAPGSAGACPVPGGQLKITGQNGSALTVKKNKSGEEEYLVNKGELLKFDASTLDLQGETPFEYSWSFTAAGSPQASLIQAPGYLWPSSSVENYKYEELGSQEGSLNLYGDYGVSTFPFKVRVLEEVSPVARFEVLTKSPTVGQPVQFNAGASTPTPGSGVEDYIWEFGDGSAAETETPEKSHPYAQSGVYTVKLKIADEAGHVSQVAEGKIEVAQESVTTTTTTTSNPGPTATTTTTTPVISTSTSAAVTSTRPGVQPPRLTRKQQLEKALKLCAKEPKKRRAACVKAAHKKYAAPKKKTSKKKKK